MSYHQRHNRPQHAFRMERVGWGFCYDCGDDRKHYDIRCDPCQIISRRRQQKRRGGDRWRPGGKGRPPVVLEPS